MLPICNSLDGDKCKNRLYAGEGGREKGKEEAGLTIKKIRLWEICFLCHKLLEENAGPDTVLMGNPADAAINIIVLLPYSLAGRDFRKKRLQNKKGSL